jgi:predicted anti-sigma-YlaC factor YlaD
MNCLRIDQIYLYLEGELSSSEYRSIKDHISSCEKCRRAVQERKRLIEASQSLPLWVTPPQFTQRILDRIFPQRITLRDWIITASVGLSSTVLAFFVVYLVSGQNLAHLFINLNQTALNLFQNVIVVLVKTAKLISVGVQVIFKIASLILKGFVSLSTFLSPEIQIGLTALTVIAMALLLIGAKRKLFAGEKA